MYQIQPIHSVARRGRPLRGVGGGIYNTFLTLSIHLLAKTMFFSRSETARKLCHLRCTGAIINTFTELPRAERKILTFLGSQGIETFVPPRFYFQFATNYCAEHRNFRCSWPYNRKTVIPRFYEFNMLYFTAQPRAAQFFWVFVIELRNIRKNLQSFRYQGNLMKGRTTHYAPDYSIEFKSNPRLDYFKLVVQNSDRNT